MLNALSEVLKNKIVSVFGAGSLVVSAEASKGGLIDITQHGWVFPWATWMQFIGCLWISILILEKIGVFKLIKYLFEKFSE